MKNVILKPGTYDLAQEGKKQPGGDLGRFILDWLVSKEILSTTDCCTYSLVGGGGGGAVATNTLAFNSTTNLLTSTVDGIVGTVTLGFDASDIRTTAAITVNGTVIASNTTIQSLLTTIAALSHSPMAVTNNASAFAFSLANQTLNIPQSSTLVDNGNGTITFTKGDGTAPVVIDVKEDATEVVTTAIITVAGTNYPVGTSVQTILGAIPASSGATNLTYTASPAQGLVSSDTGTDAILPLVDGTNAGLISPNQNLAINAIGVTAGQSDLDTFTGNTIPNDSTVKVALQSLETALELLPTGANNGLNVDTGIVQLGGALVENTTVGAGTFQLTTNVDSIVDSTVTSISSVAGTSFGMSAGTTMSMTSGSGQTFNDGAGTYNVIGLPARVAETEVVYVNSTTGKLAKGVPSGDVTASVGTNGAVAYQVLTGTPVVTLTKGAATGIGTLAVAGGTIKLKRFADIINVADMLAAGMRYDLVGTGTNQILAIPSGIEKRTMSTTNALADASTSGTISNQFDNDNTPSMKYGNISIAGQGAITVRFDTLPAADLGIDMHWI